ncbi:MAG: 16S rRNA (cytosine(967)-C(5))-methyltransferase RsmB [Blastocatellia bacterium]
MNIAPARRAAFDILQRVETSDAWAGALLAAPRYTTLSHQDRALAQELTLGVLRWRGQLDFLIEHFSRRKTSKLDTEVRIALRLGLYQLRFLSRVPAHAAINDAVNLVKTSNKQSAAPMVNAVLRAVTRTDNETISALITQIADPIARLAVETSHPAWLLDRWVRRYGMDETRALALAANQAPVPCFRFIDEPAAAAWLAENAMTFAPSVLLPSAMSLTTGHLSDDSPPVQAGHLYLQDAASQLIARLPAGAATTAQPIRILDVCAAPGNKTTLLAALAGHQATILAGDLHAHRLRAMRRLTTRAGQQNIRLLQYDAARALPFADAVFDSVLLDAPCSGLGTLQRHPEIRWRAAENRIAELATLQTQLLENAAATLRPGGLLTYAVCSTEPEEGEDIIARFRARHPEYRDITRERLTELGLDPAPLLTPAFGARTFPHRHQSEGFFFCVMWKRSQKSEVRRLKTDFADKQRRCIAKAQPLLTPES